MALDDDIRVLSGVGLFEGFTREQLRLMAFGAESMTLGAGRDIYGQGAPGDCAFVVASGTVALFAERDGARHTVETVEAGGILGELALISETSRLTGATTQTEVRLIRLNRTMFHRILEEFPDTAVLLHDRIASQLQATIRRIETVAARLIE